jgi:cytochrome c553
VPQLKTQQPAYIERRLAGFAQGFRQNDMNEQMRTIAAQLTPDKMHVIAGSTAPVRRSRRWRNGK